MRQPQKNTETARRAPVPCGSSKRSSEIPCCSVVISGVGQRRSNRRHLWFSLRPDGTPPGKEGKKMAKRCLVGGFALSAVVLLSTGLAFGATNLWVGEAPPFEAQRLGTGGPDAYGYQWIDSDTVGGPTYDWIDITGIGTQVMGLADDNVVGPFPIGFDFPYYWYWVDSLYVGSNGYIAFGDNTNESHPFQQFPDPMKPNNLLSPLMSDLTFDFGSPSCYYYTSAGLDTFIISYIDVPFWDAGGGLGNNTFQIILSRADSAITFQYLDQTGAAPNPPGALSVGIEEITGTIGLQYFYDAGPPENAIHDSLAIRLYPPDSTTLVIDDIAVTKVCNQGSWGFFLFPGTPTTLWSVIQNVGNQSEAGFDVYCQVRDPSNAMVFADTVTVASLNPGEEDSLVFTPVWTPTVNGEHKLEVRSLLVGDMTPSNDSVMVEVRGVTYPTDLQWDDDLFETGYTWNGTNSGWGNRFTPPAYPTWVKEARCYINAVYFPPQSIVLGILDDSGPGGSPGNWLVQDTISVTSPGVWYTYNFATDSIVITSGSFYVGYIQLAASDPYLGMDMTPLYCRNTWEFTGAWAPSRHVDEMDNGLRAVVDFIVGVDESGEEPSPATSSRLFQNCPNPFFQTTDIRFQLPAPGHATLTVYDAAGRVVATLLDEELSAGAHKVRWEKENTPAGIYFYKLTSGQFSSARKLIVLR